MKLPTLPKHNDLFSTQKSLDFYESLAKKLCLNINRKQPPTI